MTILENWSKTCVGVCGAGKCVQIISSFYEKPDKIYRRTNFFLSI